MAAPPFSATRPTVATPAPRKASKRDIGRLSKRLVQGTFEVEPSRRRINILGNVLLQMRIYTSVIIVVVVASHRRFLFQRRGV